MVSQFRCVVRTPFERPVVPPVGQMTETSCGCVGESGEKVEYGAAHESRNGSGPPDLIDADEVPYPGCLAPDLTDLRRKVAVVEQALTALIGHDGDVVCDGAARIQGQPDECSQGTQHALKCSWIVRTQDSDYRFPRGQSCVEQAVHDPVRRVLHLAMRKTDLIVQEKRPVRKEAAPTIEKIDNPHAGRSESLSRIDWPRNTG